MADVTISASNDETILNAYTDSTVNSNGTLTQVLLSSVFDALLGAPAQQDIASEFLSVYRMVFTPFGTQSTAASSGGESWRD